MKKITLLGMTMLYTCAINAQHIFNLLIKHGTENIPLHGATVVISNSNRTAISDSLGIASFTNLPAGNYSFTISFVGMAQQIVNAAVPSATNAPMTVLLIPEEADAEEVIITSTRTSRSIKDIPTRVETISGEELAEKSNMKPGDIRMLLNESTGIQTQQTSATSYNSSVRIQGLDGRYTQILKDGFPLYAGFSGGLSLMQVAPLDLQQVEVIKGSSSTLYGGGAIAGLVNLVSIAPSAKRKLNFITNGTSAGGLDLSGFYAERYQNTGLTVFGSRNTNNAYDPAGIGLTAIPKFERYTINPKLFLYGKQTTANVGIAYISEDRTGGSIDYIKNGGNGYFENNKTTRFTTQFDIKHSLTDRSGFEFKNSYSNFNRTVTAQGYIFEGIQQSSYSEFNFHTKTDETFLIAGVNFLTDDFKEKPHTATAARGYHYNTIGVFAQNTWNASKVFSIETGLRADYTKQYGVELLPRFSLMAKLDPKFVIRVGGGLGYKTPTVFSEDAEKIQFRRILPIDEELTANERSVGGNIDLNYRTRIGNMSLTINQLFFYTWLNKALILSNTTSGDLLFKNANGHIDSKGMETNIRLVYGNLKLFTGYTYTDVNTHFNNSKQWLPLTPRHRLNNVLMYEQEGKYKLGLEAYYFSRQQLSNGSTGRSYWNCGVMGERSWEHFSLFINFENVFDVRQTRFDSIYTGPITNPVFGDIYAPVDGFVVNGGIKIKL